MEQEEKMSPDIRLFRPGEDQEILSCLRDEYGDTYYTKEYYTDGFFTKKVAAGSMDILLVWFQGECAGFLILKNDSYSKGQTELSTMVIKKAFRRHGASTPLIKTGMDMVRQKGVCACFGHSQVFHDISIRKLYALGLRPTGFMLSMFLAEKLAHSFGKTKSPKLPWAITMLPLEKRDAGILCVAPHLAELTRRIYTDLGVRFEIRTAKTPPMDAHTALEVRLNEGQNTLLLYVRKVGKDLCDCVKREIAACPPALLTVNLWLNVGDPAAVYGYEALKANGFFFTGYQALAQGAEFMVLHNGLGVPIDFEDFRPYEPIDYILAFMKREYEGGTVRNEEYN